MHRSERTSTLAAGLAALLRDIPADPFTPEIVAVPTPGIERFITQSLSLVLGTSEAADGVCANVDFPSPAAVVQRVIAQAGGIAPEADPWLPGRMVWPLLSVIEDSADEPWCEAITRHLAGADRRFAVASRLAALFDSYAAQRPSLLLEWFAGRDSAPADLRWQPQLWRAVRHVIGMPSPAERMHTAALEITARPDLVDLPDRLSVFGPSRLPANHLAIFAALARHREVHFWLPDASPALWSALGVAADRRRRDDTSASVVQHPLLRSLGRDARELRLRLTSDHDEHLPSPQPAATLLGSLQRQVRDNLPAAPAVPDRSLTIHSCHGQGRQAEVIREVILGLLEADPTLEPRDIIVMCPDLDTFAPLLSAAFSAPDAVGTVRLRIADRTPEQANDILAAVAALLDLLTGRMTLSDVLDFTARIPVRTRFGFDDDDLERLETLCTQARIRWGLDAAHRQEFKVTLPAGTWSWGMDRLLLGSALSEDGLPVLNGVLPVDDVNSGDVELVGRMAEIVTRLQALREAMTHPREVSAWVSLLVSAIDDLTEVRGPDAWQHANAVGAMNALGQTAAGSAAHLTLADVRWLLNDVLTGRPTRANFRSGDLTVCGFAPMRSVPHRVICLVGMDDGSFPRATVPDGNDLLARDPRVGERDVRSEDRQVLLDAIMAAEESLVITYAGADERTNEVQPPCVPLADLLDTLDAMTDGQASRTLVVKHPLQPFHPANFIPGALGPGPFSHDSAALAAAERAREPRQEPASMALVLPEDDISTVTLSDLTAFLTSPVKAFLKRRIGISVHGDIEPGSEQIPVDLDGLGRWKIGDRALALLTRGAPVPRIVEAEKARGDLPPGLLGEATLQDVGRTASDVAGRVAALRTAPPRQVSVDLVLANGVRLVGAVGDVFGTSIVHATYSKSKPRDELRLWPALLAAAATEPGTWTGHTVTQDADVTLQAPTAEQALTILAELVTLLRSGTATALPLPMSTAALYAEKRRAGVNPEAARHLAENKRWKSTRGKYERRREQDDPEMTALYGQDAPLAAVLAASPLTDENWFDEQTRFGMLARRVWEPIIAARRSQ